MSCLRITRRGTTPDGSIADAARYAAAIEHAMPMLEDHENAVRYLMHGSAGRLNGKALVALQTFSTGLCPDVAILGRSEYGVAGE